MHLRNLHAAYRYQKTAKIFNDAHCAVAQFLVSVFIFENSNSHRLEKIESKFRETDVSWYNGRTPFKPLNTIVLCYSRGFWHTLNWVSMMPEGARLSHWVWLARFSSPAKVEAVFEQTLEQTFLPDLNSGSSLQTFSDICTKTQQYFCRAISEFYFPNLVK